MGPKTLRKQAVLRQNFDDFLATSLQHTGSRQFSLANGLLAAQ